MSVNNKITNGDRNWNGKKLIELSEDLGKAYNPGADNTRLKSDRKADFWTVDKFIAMSRNLSSAYGVDY